ncbi:MAG TPA: ATP-binding protein [Verrucomicrobiae bacterium]|nr:ATP-binding protein [Verrucomicrobiae bacterium]
MKRLAASVARVFSGLRFRLLALVVLACAPLVVLMLHTAGEDRRRAIAAWRDKSRELQNIANRDEEQLIGSTRQLLLAVSESSYVHSFDPRRCQKGLDDLFATYPRFANLGVLTTNGDVLASARPVIGKKLADRDFVQKAFRNHAFTIGSFPAGTAPATISFGYPVLSHSGALLGLVFAELDLQYFDRFGTELPGQLPTGATWTELDRAGTVLTRYPAPESWIGKPLADPGLLADVFGRAGGVLERQTPEGMQTFYAFQSRMSGLAKGEVVSVLSIPRQVLFAQADRALRTNLIWLAIAAGSACLIGLAGGKLLILRPVKALARSSAQLALGDLSVRTGVAHTHDELGQLTLAFDQMAQALEQRELERQRAAQKLQVLSHRLVEVQETERRHIARELHDEIGQSLTVAEMNLQAALRSSNTAAKRQRLEDSIQAVERVLEQVHDLSLNLRPSILDDLGLEPALRWYTNRQAALTGLRAEFKPASLESRLDVVIETECFRVAQEALTNVVRHANARAVTVDLSQRNGHLHLLVRDDGVGFDVTALRNEAVQGASLGLLSMEERTSLAGGGLEFNSSPGQGTEVHAWFPLRWHRTDNSEPTS